tara:strand:- start:89 stop:442 length:354 start_codon:yes stop_codon:yes gene_type:complete
MSVVTFFTGFILGIFAWSNIVLPLLFALPLAKRLARANKLTKPIPIRSFVLAPITWSLVLGGLWYWIHTSHPDLQIMWNIGMVCSLILIICQIPLKNQDLLEDFVTTWGNYIKEDWL